MALETTIQVVYPALVEEGSTSATRRAWSETCDQRAFSQCRAGRQLFPDLVENRIEGSQQLGRIRNHEIA